MRGVTSGPKSTVRNHYFIFISLPQDVFAAPVEFYSVEFP